MQNSVNQILNLIIKWGWKTKIEIIDNLDLILKIIDFNNQKFNFIYKKSRPFSTRETYANHAKNINTIRNFLLNKNYEKLIVENKINAFFGYLMPTNEKFNNQENNTYDKLLELSKRSYYIKYDKKNINWSTTSKDYGTIKMSINNSKPEKTQSQILLDKNYTPQNGDPKCPICLENLGYKGGLTKESKENLRVIFINLYKEKWFFQYSPYAYLKKHFILIDNKHTEMKITKKTIKQLVEFVSNNKQYFLGTNADLPIVGGSLLGHNHFQGAEDELPIMNAKSIYNFSKDNCQVDILKWPLSSVRISANDCESLIKLSNKMIFAWKGFESKEIINQNNNTTTILVNSTGKKMFAYLIFRNNSVSKENKFGNYHIKPKRFNIKQENIGIMEAAGLSILPKRLESELSTIHKFIENNEINKIKNDPSVSKHWEWLSSNNLLNLQTTLSNLYEEVNNTFIKCLEDCNVFQSLQLLKEFIIGIK